MAPGLSALEQSALLMKEKKIKTLSFLLYDLYFEESYNVDLCRFAANSNCTFLMESRSQLCGVIKEWRGSSWSERGRMK